MRAGALVGIATAALCTRLVQLIHNLMYESWNTYWFYPINGARFCTHLRFKRGGSFGYFPAFSPSFCIAVSWYGRALFDNGTRTGHSEDVG